mmetsp:Transcript_42186/g.64687  ORF Transcript_42186/g.64687 Transcript_42186/m.64687 type:complete len:139 (-) Transcript_42186:548-964(-)
MEQKKEDTNMDTNSEKKREVKPAFKFDFESSDFYVFKKEPYLDIGELTSKQAHVKRNKISDKFRRRDVQYYDLYALNSPVDDFSRVKEDIGCQTSKEAANIKELYGDLAEPDFNLIFRTNGDIIGKKFGKTLEITLTV